MTPTDFEGDPKRITITANVVTDDLSVEPNKCLSNSIKAASKYNDLIVEGVLIVVRDGAFDNAQRHCWNKRIVTDKTGEVLNELYYDVTNDFLFAKLTRDAGLEESKWEYRYFACAEYPFSDCNVEDEAFTFKHEYTTLINFIEDKARRQ